MKRARQRFLRFLPQALLLTFAFGCSSHSPTLASVDGDPITRDDLVSYLSVKQTVRVNPTVATDGSTSAQVADPLGYQGLEDLVRDKVVFHLAKQQGVYPSKHDIDDEIGFQKELDEDGLASLYASGWDVAAIRRQLTLQLCVSHMITKGVCVTDKDVDDYIAANPSIVQRPSTIRAYWILVSSASKKAEVDRQLLSGQQFQVVASQFSEADGAAASQGLFPDDRLGALPAKLQAILKTTGESQTTPWVQTTSGYAKWFIDQITPAITIPVDDAVRDTVRRQIAIQRGAKVNHFNQQLSYALLNCHVEFSIPGYEDLWEVEISNLAHGHSNLLTLPTPIGQ